MDNARIHHAILVKEYMENENKYNNKIIYNIPYNPETNPIELIFSNVKRYFRKYNKNGISNIEKLIDKSFKKITSKSIENSFIKSLERYCIVT